MKIPLSFLQEFLHISLSKGAIADTLTLLGLEVEGVYGEDDPIFDIALTPNLGHCSSALGIAQELSAALQIPIKMPKIALIEELPLSPLTLSIKTPLCSRYAFRVLEGVKVAPSPQFLQKKIEALGLKPINTIVDVTNLILHLYGQPLHAYDLTSIEGGLEIGESDQEISVEFLDDIVRTPPKNSLWISDKEKPLCLAGIMGSKASSISDKTTSIVLESAYFDPESIRKTAKTLNIKTESSSRFEKGTDPARVLVALDAAAYLIQQIARGEIGPVCEEKGEISQKKISCRLERASRIIGRKFSLSELENIFQRLGCHTTSQGEKVWVIPPSYRHDIHTEIDLIEELIRIYGYNNLQRTIPYFTPSSLPHDPFYIYENKVKESWVREGFSEVLTPDLISPKMAEIVPNKNGIPVLHSKTEDHTILRTSLFPGLLQVVQFNLFRNNKNLQLFEIGKIHFQKEGQILEQLAVAGIITGDKEHLRWDLSSQEVDIFDLKGRVENILTSLYSLPFSFTPSTHPCLHPFRQGSLVIEGNEIGVVGEVHPNILKQYDCKQRVQYVEINLTILYPLLSSLKEVTAPPQYPGSERDWTITVPEELPLDTIQQAIQSAFSPLLTKVELISLYRGEKVAPKMKNFTFRFYYKDLEKTLSLEEIEEEHASLLSHIAKKVSLS